MWFACRVSVARQVPVIEPDANPSASGNEVEPVSLVQPSSSNVLIMGNHLEMLQATRASRCDFRRNKPLTVTLSSLRIRDLDQARSRPNHQ
jgi:hypothetical protein